MPKEDCKYWDKCYQRNEAHLEKYNHPSKETDIPKMAPKRKTTSTADNKEEVSPQKEDSPNTSSSAREIEAVAAVGEYETETAQLHKEAMNNIAGKNYMEILEKRIRLSVQQEYDNLCESNEFIRHKFLVEMPPDFYAFWQFINTLKKDTTKTAVLQHIEQMFQLQLVAPFEFLAGKFHKAKIGEPGDYLRHWRFYYDPPEFQTVFVRKNTGIHYGYWRDVPQDKDRLLLARNDSTQNCEFQFIAGNIFDAFLYYLEHDFVGTPFNTAQVAATKKAVKQHLSDNPLPDLDTLTKERNKRVMAKSFHRAGIVVPYERKSQQGYRPLPVSDAELKKILALFERKDLGVDSDNAKQAVLEKLQPVANAANIAVDECDFGTALELGLDLFSSGHKELHMLISSLLVPAYSLLSRPQFIAIAKAHMEQRSKELNLSIFEVLK
ncbi:histone PARylation factor 1-like [Drosophila nasuta]|uniref:histone PARylation factor 1-like n=1 Tax=Drosophila nasuta TaxID=42062 RepID=UPI00295F57AB|nr:histone PARylation factor 1-like [Drosophila nasuta]